MTTSLQSAVAALSSLGCHPTPTNGGSAYTARCPCHEDSTPSLSVSQGDKQAVILHCHAGCDPRAIFKALGIQSNPATNRRIVATYDYHDAQGALISQKVRYEPKDFRQRWPDGKGGWLWKRPSNAPYVLYRLPELLAAIEKGETVYLAEGEKDADRLAALGLTATTHIEGAAKPDQKAKWRPDYTAQLSGAARVILIPDNDEPGRAHMAHVAKLLGQRATVVELPGLPEKGDVSDWLDHGHTLAALHGLETVRQTVEAAVNAKEKDFSHACRENSNHTLPTLPTYSVEIQLDQSYIKRHASYISFMVSQLEELDEKGHPTLIESNAAAILADSLKNRFAFCRESLRWHLFTQTHWQPLTSPLIDEVVTRLMYAGAPHGFKARTVTAILSLLTKGLLPLPETARSNAQAIPFTNGLLNPVTRELTPISLDNALTWCLPYAFDPHADCPTVKAWLRNAVQSEDETDNPDELVQFLRAWLAALLTGRADLQRFLHLLGPGGTGKGTFIRLAEALVGKQNATVTDLRNLEQNRFETAMLYGKRLVAVTDSGKYGGGIDVFKALTGQDPLRMEVKHRQQGATFIFDGLTLIASNEPLQFTDYTSAVERRRMTVEFSHQVSDDERADWDRQGGETAVLHREISGVVNWVLALSRDEVTHLLTNPPGPIQRANRQAMQHSNPVADWLMQCVESDSTHTLMIGGFSEFTHTEKNALGETESRTIIEDVDRAAYPNYRAWCLRYHRAPVSARRFSGLVLDVARTLGMSAYRGRNMSGMYLKGLRLRPKDGGYVEIHVGTSLIHVGSVESNQKNLITKTINYEANVGNEGKRPTNYSYSAREEQNDSPLATRILTLLRSQPAGFDTEEIARQVGNGKGASSAMVEMVLNHLAKAGDVGRLNGRWVASS